jgi:hypothetical protein
MSTTCSLANEVKVMNKSKHKWDTARKLGCSMANISARWLGHFDYRPVIEPVTVWPQIAMARPGLLWHPVKASRPLSSTLLDKAYGKPAAEAVTAANHRASSFPDESVEAPGRSMLAPPRSYKPAEYFLSEKHVPWQ